MTKQDIIDYIMETPGNTNPAILNQMIDEVGGGGSGESGGGNEDIKVFIVNSHNESTDSEGLEGTITLDKTWQEIEVASHIYNCMLIKSDFIEPPFQFGNFDLITDISDYSEYTIQTSYGDYFADTPNDYPVSSYNFSK